MNERDIPTNNNDRRLNLVKRVSKLMDEQFSIGNFKFGIDPLLNLLPVAGDFSSYIISVAIIITAARYGVSGKVIIKMLGNATLDALIGTIPIIGWFFDFTYKANTRNVKLLTEHYTQGKHRGSAKPVIISIVVVMFIVLIAVAYLSFVLLKWLINYFDDTIGITI